MSFLPLAGRVPVWRWCVVLTLVAGIACNGDQAPPTTSAPTRGDTIATTTTTRTGATPTTAEQAPLDTRMQWLANVFTTGELPESEYEATFTAEFIEAVPYDRFMAVVRPLADGREWTVGEFEQREGTSGTARILASDGETWRANMTLETVPPHRIAGLLVQPTEPPTLDDPPADFEQAAARLGEMGDLELAVMEVAGGECRPIFEAGEGDPAPVGSAIKLYVLAAVADEVEAGGLAWDDDIPIVEEHRSIPTGVLQDEEAGETFSLREMAETMIAFSDNTATDHLIGLVGRERVEAALGAHGMADPSRNIPFMDTMDLTALKIGPAAGLATRWLESDDAGRRQILEQISDIRPDDIPLGEFTEPVRPHRIEWFASPSDMCRVLVDLNGRGEPLTQILTINPGLPDDEGRFATVAFKGGAEPGLVAMNWLLERPDGRRFVVSGSVVNPDQPIDQLRATLLFGAVRDMVADQ